MEVIRMATDKELGFTTCRSKLAEVLEKVLKAELIRLGWELEKTHDLDRLLDALVARQSDLASAVEPLCDALAEVYFTDRYPGFDLDDPGLWSDGLDAIAQLVDEAEALAAQVDLPAGR